MCHTNRIPADWPLLRSLRICGIWLEQNPPPGASQQLAAHASEGQRTTPHPQSESCPSPFAHSPCISSSGQPCGWLAHPCSSGAATSQDWLHRCGARPDNGTKDQPRIDVILPPKWSINMGPGVDMREEKKSERACVNQPPSPTACPPEVLFANEKSRGRNKFNLSGRVLIYPTVFLRVRA